MKKITRSNSDDDIRLRPVATLIHSKPTSHGAGEMSFGARDDGSSMSSSNEYVALSSYQNTSSAIAGSTKGYISDRQHVTAMSEQQPTVAHTYELSLPIKLLSGEDDVKLREDITYRTNNRSVPYRGELIVTKYRLMFVTKPPDTIQVLVDVPLGMISQIEKIGGQARSNISDGAAYGIEINCKDLRHFFFGNAKEQNQRRNLLDHLTRLVFPFSISKADITNPLQFFNFLYCFQIITFITFNITLRLLRIRTLRDRCLHEFNYLRSIQRTLTIYEQRLTMTSKGKEFHSIDQRFSHYIPHTYLFDTPHQCTFDILNYMQSGEHIDNVDDYAYETTIDNDGSIVHIKDSTGLHIIYDCAFNDVNELEQEMICIGSYFIEKASLKYEKDNDFQRKIDRFEILYNLWEYEINYLQYKRKLIDCFYEIYQHTFDHDERHLIGQTIIDIIARRPRIDFRNDNYFSHSYSLEIHLLNQYLSLIREYIDRHIIYMRQITENLFDSTDYGSYFSATRLQSSPPIYLSVSKIHSYHLFEFLESLSSLTRLPYLLKQTFNELIEFEQLQRQTNLSLTEKILYELEYIDEIYLTYKQLDQPGAMFSSNQQRDIFNTLYSDHPTMMGKFAYEILKQIDEARTTKKEQYEKFIKLNTNLIELLTLRYRLIRSASECELLTKIYKQQLDIMSIDYSHLFLRYVQFEFSQPRNLPNTDNEYDNEPSHIADGRLDKITGQKHLLLAVQELDESSIGRISFRQKDQWLTLINDADDVINNLKIALRLQIMHNHFVYTAILQHRVAIVCITQQLQSIKVDTGSEQTKTPPTGKRQNSGNFIIHYYQK
ncbi:unnamed protein product [Rotaria sp. Silwood2]|nr:unnamed protein product [Rotaria sp. Silwood2]